MILIDHNKLQQSTQDRNTIFGIIIILLKKFDDIFNFFHGTLMGQSASKVLYMFRFFHKRYLKF